MAYFLLRERFQYSYPQIAAAFKKDSSTIIQGYKKLKQQMQSDVDLMAAATLLMKKVERLVTLSSGNVIYTTVSTPVRARLEELLKTGMYGNDLGDVVERLVCQQLQGLKSK